MLDKLSLSELYREQDRIEAELEKLIIFTSKLWLSDFQKILKSKSESIQQEIDRRYQRSFKNTKRWLN